MTHWDAAHSIFFVFCLTNKSTAIHIRKYYFAYVSKRQIENDVYRVVRFKYTPGLKVRRTDNQTGKNIIPGVFSIKKLKPVVAKTVAKRGGSTSIIIINRTH